MLLTVHEKIYMNLKLFPWDHDEKPYWINPENGIEWYIDNTTTDYCSSVRGPLPPLDAVCFYVCENKSCKITPLTRILLCKKTNSILCEENNLEQLACKIDVMRFLKNETGKQVNVNSASKNMTKKRKSLK
jgi:hypothetical protein